jgi:hypothetical protein
MPVRSTGSTPHEFARRFFVSPRKAPLATRKTEPEIPISGRERQMNIKRKSPSQSSAQKHLSSNGDLQKSQETEKHNPCLDQGEIKQPAAIAIDSKFLSDGTAIEPIRDQSGRQQFNLLLSHGGTTRLNLWIEPAIRNQAHAAPKKSVAV